MSTQQKIIEYLLDTGHDPIEIEETLHDGENIETLMTDEDWFYFVRLYMRNARRAERSADVQRESAEGYFGASEKGGSKLTPHWN